MANKLKSWESDGDQPIAGTDREHFTIDGVKRRIRKLRGAGRIGHGEMPDGRGYLVAVEQIPNSWSLGSEHMQAVHRDGSECHDGCDAAPLRRS